MSAEKIVAECLLSSAGDAGPKSVRIWNHCRVDHEHAGRVHRDSGEYVGDRVKRPEALVDCNFENCSSGIYRVVHGPKSSAVPATGDQKSSFAGVPCGRVCRLVQSPSDKFGTAERPRQWRHA